MTIDELKQQKRWVCWRREVVKSKETKVPYMPSGRRAKSNDPNTWSTHAECVAVSQLIGIALGTASSAWTLTVAAMLSRGSSHQRQREMVIALDS